MTELSNIDEYLRQFSGEVKAPQKQIEALKSALDIRKFEIELYWKRAAYFWTFTGAALAGYFLLIRLEIPYSFEPTYVVSVLGLVFSIAWYFVNRGSKAWQRNWEAHVDLLEDEIQGPLYKTGINRYTYHFWNITDAFPFSVSKINQILNLFVAAIWLFLSFRTLFLIQWSEPSHKATFLVATAVSVVTLWLLYKQGRTSKTDAEIEVNLRQRRYVSKRETSGE